MPSPIFTSLDAAIYLSRITTAMTPTATLNLILKEKQQIGKTIVKKKRRRRKKKRGVKKEVSHNQLMKSLKKKRTLAKTVGNSKEQMTTMLRKD